MWILNDISDSMANRRYYSIFSEKPIVKKDTNGPYIANFFDSYLGCIEECFLPKLNYLETAEINICIKGDINYLSNYTDEQLKAELDKRKLARKEEKEKILRCRHCANFDFDDTRPANQSGYCIKQSIINKKGIARYKIMSKSTKACDIFIHIDNEKVK